MKIKAVELMEINKGLKFGEEPNTKTSEGLAEPPVSKPQSGMNALEMQMNNIAFMGKSAIATKLKGKTLGAMMALMTLGAAPLVQSCEGLSREEINTNIEINIDLTAITALYQQMLAYNQQMLEQNKITNEELMKMNATLMQLLQQVQNGNITAEEYYQRAYEFMANSETYQNIIIDQLVANGKSQEEANKYLQDLIANVKNGQITAKEALDEIQKILGSINSKLDTIIGKLDEAIKKFEDRDDETKAQLTEIKNLLKQNNSISAGNYELLESLLINMNKLCTSDQVMSALNEIASIMKSYMAQDKEMDEETNALLKEALNYIAAVGFEMNRNFSALIQQIKNGNYDGKLDELSSLLAELTKLVSDHNEDSMALGDKVLNYIAALGFDMNKNFTAVINAINNGTKGTESLKSLLEKVLDNQNKNTKSILEAIGNINIDGSQIDLSSIEAMMKELAAQAKTNGNILTSINGKLDAINLTADAINAKIEAEAKKGDTRYAKLEKFMNDILGKLGSSGVSYDDSELLEILGGLSDMIDGRMDELLDAIKNHDVKVTVDVTGKVKCECNCGKNDEGIIGDLDNLMG